MSEQPNPPPFPLAASNSAPVETGASTSAKPEPSGTAASEHINLRVADQSGGEVFFKIKRTTPLRKLMEAYCQRQSHRPTDVRFLYDGARVQPEDTPKSLDLEDNDVLDVMLQQTGGSGLSAWAIAGALQCVAACAFVATLFATMAVSCVFSSVMLFGYATRDRSALLMDSTYVKPREEAVPRMA
jgi:small ubiquitin-related modifier